MHNDLKKFRTMAGAERRQAMRDHLQKHSSIDFDKSHFELTHSERSALQGMAKAVSWRRSISSTLSVCAAFYVYLSRDVQNTVHAAAVSTRPRCARRALSYGKGIDS